VCLSCECGGGRSARSREEAGRRRREAHKGFREVDLAKVVVASVLVAMSGIRWGNRELGVDLVERVLRRGEAELALEQGRLGRVFIGVGEVQPLGWIQELLRLLDKAREVQHGGIVALDPGRLVMFVTG
jgi:hypothetical protein